MIAEANNPSLFSVKTITSAKTGGANFSWMLQLKPQARKGARRRFLTT